MKFYRFVSGTAFGSLLTIGGALVVAEYQIRSGIQKRDSITKRVRAFFRSVSGEQIDSLEESIHLMLTYHGILIRELTKKGILVRELINKKDGGTAGRMSVIERPTVVVKSSGLNLKTPMLPFFSPRGDWEKQKQLFIQQSLTDKRLPRAYDKLYGYKLRTTPSGNYNISSPNPLFKSKDVFVPCPYEETMYNKYTGVVSSLFNQLGQVVSVGVCRDLSTRRSLGYGYVNYANPQDAYLRKMFGEFGPITGAVVMRDGDGKSKCFGFVNFEDAEDAARYIEALIRQKFDLKEWYVGKAQKKSEREQALKGQFEQTVKEAVDKSQGLNLCIKNLEDTIGDDKLMEMFSQFGTITSCKAMLDPNETSKGSGFVAFSTPEEDSKALAEMNGKMVANKPLYVALAQREEDRRARLQAQFSQMRPIAMAPSVAPRMPMFPPGGPGLGQQVFHGQPPPAFIPPQLGFGYQQQLVPAMRPGGAPVQNFFVPMGGKQGQHPGGRHSGAVPGQQGQQPVPLMQHQMLPRGRLYRYPPGRGLPDVSMPGMGGGM